MPSSSPSSSVSGISSSQPSASKQRTLGSVCGQISQCHSSIPVLQSRSKRRSTKAVDKQTAFRHSFSDSDCLDLASDDSGTDLTEPLFETTRNVRYLSKVSRKNSLDAKLQQLRKKALNTHQSRYQRECAKEKHDRFVSSCSSFDHEDLLANSIEDSESEEEDEKAARQDIRLSNCSFRPLSPPNDQPSKAYNMNRRKNRNLSHSVNGLAAASTWFRSRNCPQAYIIGNATAPVHYLKVKLLYSLHAHLQDAFFVRQA